MSMLDRRAVIRGATVTALGAAAAYAGTGSSSAAPVWTPRSANPALGEPRSLDGRPMPEYDYSRANRLPREMTGYWTKSFDIAGIRRTAKIYISPETPIRSYYTVLAVPDGIDTSDFLRRTGWRDIADARGEGLFLLEPGPDGWGSAVAESEYVDAAIRFYEANGYFSIFGEHYLVGYGAGAPPLERWAAANPLRVISQVHLDSQGLPESFLDQVGDLEYDGTTAPGYVTVEFPEGFRLIRRDEVVLPTWYVNPRGAGASLAHWRAVNDARPMSVSDPQLGTVYPQRRDSERWMTSYSGPISKVAVRRSAMPALSRATTRQVLAFLTFYSRYENFFAYGNQLIQRPDLKKLGVEIGTMTVAGQLREYMIYEPPSAHRMWGEQAPVVFVWPGNTQTDRVFFDSSAWWQVAQDEGFILVVICEQYTASPISVSHQDSEEFFHRLRSLVVERYRADPSRFYSTGQSAGSRVSQIFAMAKPEYFAAVASTSFVVGPDASGQVTLEGVALPVAHKPIPNYQIYGYGDLRFLEGTVWDDIDNALDDWTAYQLGVNGLTLADVEDRDGERSGWKDRYRTWTWSVPGTAVPAVKISRNEYRSHNNIQEETPRMWHFLKHYRHEVRQDGTILRWYSPSAFQASGDAVEIPG